MLSSKLISQKEFPSKSLTIVIPTRGGRGLIDGEKVVFVENIITKLHQLRLPSNTKIKVVIDTETPKATKNWLRQEQISTLEVDGEFNFSKKCNIGALSALSEFLLFLNDDVDVIESDFISHLISPFGDKKVGIVGANLRFPDGTIQHVGHSYADGEYSHPYSGLHDWETPTPANMQLEREVSGVTAACLMTKADTFLEVGGFSELFPVNFNDVDFCLKVRNTGKKIIWSPSARLIHFESKTRIPQIAEFELMNLRARWGIPAEEKFQF